MPALLSTLAAATGAKEGTVAVGEAGGDMTLWLALSAVAMIGVLLAAQWVVARRPRA